MKKIVICTSRNLFKSGCGEYYKVKSFVYAFQGLGYEVEILSTSLAKPKQNFIWNCKIVHQKRSFLKFLQNFVCNFPTSIQRALFAADTSHVKESIIYSLIRTVSYNPKNQNVIVDFADVLSINFLRISKKTSGPLSWLKRLESVLIACDEVDIGNKYPITVVSFPEYRYCKKKGWACHHVMQPAPISLDFNCEHPIQFPPKQRQAIFVGPNGYFPNHESLQWLSKNIVPKLPKQWRIIWAGRNDRLCSYDGIDEVGYVDDLASLISSSALIFVPISTSTGIQNKLLDSLYLNCHTIAYNKISKNSNFHPSEYLIKADNETSFIIKTLEYINGYNYRPQSNAINDEYGLNPFKLKVKLLSDEYFSS